MALRLRSAARSEVGLVRQLNEDSGYAGPHLLAVADGMGGHAAGEVASAAAIDVVQLLEPNPSGSAQDPAAMLRESVARAGQRLREMIATRPELEGMGTTLTILLQQDEFVAIAQVGDSRAYLLRDGVLEQLTHDQTFVQTLVDEGRISSEAAMVHPQRSLLLQALDGREDVEPVIELRTPVAGDRFLVCSDGLSAVVSEATVRDVMSAGSARDAADRLVELALKGGAPDNVTCLVADLVDDDADSEPPDSTREGITVVGAAAEPAEAVRATSVSSGRRARRTDEPGGAGSTRGRVWRLGLVLPIVLFLALVGAAAFAGYRWTQNQYYVGVDHGGVAIYKGVPQRLVGHRLSSVVEPSGIRATALPSFALDQVSSTIPADNLQQAHQIVQTLRQEAASCTHLPEGAGCPPGIAPTPTPTPTARISPKVSAPTKTPAAGLAPTASPG